MLRAALRTGRRLSRILINTPPVIGTAFKRYCNFPRIHCYDTRDYSKNSGQIKTNNDPFPIVDALTFDQVCSETLESLCDYFEELIEDSSNLNGADVIYADGVLTVNFGLSHGTYVINRQTPNKQIWLSSPTSGPKRYDLVLENGGYWIYKHDGVSLHQLLQEEIPKIFKSDISRSVDFGKCTHSLVKS